MELKRKAYSNPTVMTVEYSHILFFTPITVKNALLCKLTTWEVHRQTGYTSLHLHISFLQYHGPKKKIPNKQQQQQNNTDYQLCKAPLCSKWNVLIKAFQCQSYTCVWPTLHLLGRSFYKIYTLGKPQTRVGSLVHYLSVLLWNSLNMLLSYRGGRLQSDLRYSTIYVLNISDNRTFIECLLWMTWAKKFCKTISPYIWKERKPLGDSAGSCG